MTTITITDPQLIKQLAEALGPIIFRDPEGNVLFTGGERIGVPPPGYVPPISVEELARRSLNREGRPLADILRDLREKYGS